MSNIKQYIFLFVGMIIITICVYQFGNNSFLQSLFTGFLGTSIFGIIIWSVNNWSYLTLYYCLYKKYRKEVIRMSLSYVYEIKINDKSLLVLNSNHKYYQPVGGVYKRYAGADSIFRQLEIKPDNTYKTNGKAENDLRVLVPAKNVVKFLKWFKIGEEREVDFNREFQEELIDTGILSIENFRKINTKFVMRIQSPIHRAEKIKNYQILVYDVITINLTDAQKYELLELQKIESEEFKWVEDEIIENLGHNLVERCCKFDIGRHAKIVKNRTWSRE